MVNEPVATWHGSRGFIGLRILADWERDE